MIRARIGLAALLALAACQLWGLDPSMPLGQYGHDVWTSDSGLPQNSISAILQTRDGYLWLGTQEGLVRFDGVKFTVFDTRNSPALKDDWIQTLSESKDGTLWIGTVTGLSRFRQGDFLPPLPGGLENAIVTALFPRSDGSVWVGSDLGVSRVTGEAVRTFDEAAGLPAGRVYSIAEDAEGRLWVGTGYGAAVMDAGGRFRPRFVRDGFPGAGLSLLRDGDGLWVGSGRGLARLEKGSTRRYGLEDGLTNLFVRTLARDRHGNLWVGTDGGLFRFRDGRFVRYGEDEGLSSNRILSLLEDREGSLWVGTADGGLERYRDLRIATYTETEGLSDGKLWSVFEDSRGIVWAGTVEGVLNRLAPGSDRFEPVVSLGAAIMAIAEDPKGGLWIGTRGGGLAHLSGARVTRYTMADGLSGNWISSVLVDRRGVLWVGTMGAGLDRFENGSFTVYRKPDGLGADSVFSVFEDAAGDLWIGTFGGGVTRLSEGHFQTFTTRDGMAHDVVMSTYQDSEGAYWFATRGGLTRYARGRFTSYRQKEGLFHDAPQRVVEDGRGYLWLTSNRGVIRVSLAELASAAREPGPIGDRATFSTATRMILAECNNGQHGAWRGRDGRLWFATVKGLVMADPARIQLNPVPPPMAIEQIRADGQTIPTPSTGVFRLSPGTRHLEFSYTALAFRNPRAVRFRYRLEDFDKDWVEAGTRRTAYYTNLPPGRYRFRVKAANEDGVWNEAGASSEFVLERRFDQTLWFRTLALAALAAGAAALYRLRMRQRVARERLRTALVEAQLDALQFQLRPHFLFNTLNSILPLVGKDPDRARQMVVRLGELLRMSLRSEDTPLVTIDEEVAMLETYLSIEQVRFRDRLEISIVVDPDVASARIPSFLLQPLVENAIKHGLPGRGGRGRIGVAAQREGSELAICVRDNGPGPRASSIDTSAGIGLRNTRRRLEALYPGRHRLELVEASGGGAEVRLRIPVEIAPADEAKPAAISRAS